MKLNEASIATGVETVDPPRLFHPPDVSWQQSTCRLLGLSLFKKTKCQMVCLDLDGFKPSKLHSTKGDGNCFFRCLSYVATGGEDQHTTMRQRVTDTMQESHICGGKPGVMQYLAASKMTLDRTWATEVEIFAAATTLGCDIYIYSRVNGSGLWVRHPAEGINAPVCKYRKAIYLSNEHNTHYDVVVNINHPDTKYRKKNLLETFLKVILFFCD